MNNFLKDVIVVENSIMTSDQNTIEKFITDSNFSWFFYPGTILPSDISYANNCVVQKGLNPVQFSHYMYINSPDVSIIVPILNCISNVVKSKIQILKLKFNLLPNSNKKTHHWPHADIDDFNSKVMTGLYYVNDSDGPTFLFKEFAPKTTNKVSRLITIEPKKGKLVLFDSRRFHSSSSPIINHSRLVLNIIFKILED